LKSAPEYSGVGPGGTTKGHPFNSSSPPPPSGGNANGGQPPNPGSGGPGASNVNPKPPTPPNPHVVPKNAKVILDQLPGKVGKTGPIKEVPNEQALKDLFDTLSKEGKTVNPGPYKGAVKEFSDGTIVRMRPSSKSGGATLDITMPVSKLYKVHNQ
jgi:hypothetical protein